MLANTIKFMDVTKMGPDFFDCQTPGIIQEPQTYCLPQAPYNLTKRNKRDVKFYQKMNFFEDGPEELKTSMNIICSM